MALRLFNSRLRNLQVFEPKEPGKASVYVCGMTPSWHPHIGHARTFLTFDVLRRHLIAKGLKVTYIQNVTDIDDKIIERAKAEGIAWDEVVTRYYGEYEVCAQRLGLLRPDVNPHATQHMDEILEMIGGLIERRAAYETSDGVYFSVDAFPEYGKLSNRQIDELRAGVRVAVREEKRDWLDFALWKKRAADEPSWPSPWGEGRPGWHIECSALARRYFGDQFDIHGGATDLIFPHHENEIAQTETLSTKHPMAQVWMHAGLLMVEGQKMSKSFGNFIPLAELLDRHPAAAIRYLFLQTGYRKPTNFSEDAIEGASKGLSGLYADLTALRRGELASVSPPSNGAYAQFEAFLDDDLNTAGAIGWLKKKLKGREVSAEVAERCLGVLGLPADRSGVGFALEDRELHLSEDARAALRLIGGDGSPEDASLIDRVIAVRNRARAAKDFATSDRIRDALAGAGIIVKDTKTGTHWSVDAG